MENCLNFIFLSGRGASGKDTQAELLIAQNPQAVRISTGDIFRDSKSPDSKFYKKFKPYFDIVDLGGFIPDEVVLSAVDIVIDEHLQKGKDTFIFTGFPRTVNQLKALDTYLQSLREAGNNIQEKFICYAVLDEHSLRRTELRRQEAEKSGIAARTDDDPNTVFIRLEAYRDKTEPMLKQLVRERRLCIVKSNGSIEDVQERTRRALGLDSLYEGIRNPYEKR